jgi:23S rRNA (guanosine2251-2'-O)-methyltransferase
MPVSKNNLVFGRHPVMETVHAGNPIEKILLLQDIRGDFEKELRQLCKARQIPIQVVPKERINKITTQNHQGVIALLSAIRYYDLNDVLPVLFEGKHQPMVMVLDGITDVRNMGAIARTAEGAGVGALVVPGKNTAAINAEAMKTSAGALANIPVCRHHSLVNAIQLLKDFGFYILASDLRAQYALDKIDLNRPIAFILGSEEKGVSPSLLKAANETFLLQIRGQIDSYNVSVAAGMMLYEAMRQQE